MGYKVVTGISNKHVHLSEDHIGILFGAGHQLTPIKDLKQPGQFASDEKVDIIGPKGALKGIRVLGPARPETQVELSATDARSIGLAAPIRESGKLEGTPGVKLAGPAGEVELDHGAIIALRHVHLSPDQAKEAGVVDQQLVDVKTFGTRPLIFQDVVIRSGPKHEREFHVDTDEGNAAGIGNDEYVELILK
ncbi:MAG: phosphate propanoyltransferase [Clostridiales Family XIII bacterium]|jgi:putative phosphotransacetylase|nr:phosphate propanoyltransferase [Clostridiales Family XIII bacterium]